VLCGHVMADTLSDLPLVQCGNCQLGRTWPPPQTDDSSSAIFDASFGGMRLTRRPQWFHEASKRLAWVEEWTPEGLLIEVGCATGEFVIEAAAAGYDAFGIEPSEWAATASRDIGANVFQGTLSDWMREYDGFLVDAITMFHVLEHLETPMNILRECASTLADDGKLFIEVPNAASRRAMSYDSSWPGWEFRFHQWHYTPASLSALLGQAGLQVLELHEFSARPYTNRSEWGAIRSRNRAGGLLSIDLDYIRVVAGL
jgi:SAM-dependent methyltransferase